jgi:hypothetical protein
MTGGAGEHIRSRQTRIEVELLTQRRLFRRIGIVLRKRDDLRAAIFLAQVIDRWIGALGDIDLASLSDNRFGVRSVHHNRGGHSSYGSGNKAADCANRFVGH